MPDSRTLHNHDQSQGLRPVRLGVRAQHEAVVFMRSDCTVCRSEGFNNHSRVGVRIGASHLVAQLFIVDGDLLPRGTVGLSETAWEQLRPPGTELAFFSHAPALASMSAVRRKIYGQELSGNDLDAIVSDIARRRYSNIELAAFVAACGGERLNPKEIAHLTRAMARAGQRMTWSSKLVVDKHSVGGLPGNRTTPVVVAIVASHGLLIPKTSSRAITSPAGTADVMETLTAVDLSIADVRKVVEREGGCLVWGGAVSLSPADDVLIRIERALDLDSEGQMIASVLSKKAAAGSTHVVIDIPVGPTAKVRSADAAQRLAGGLEAAASAVGLQVMPMISDGTQPVGRRIGPALEARDVLEVLRTEASAPADLRDRAVTLAGAVLEASGRAPRGTGAAAAAATIDSGQAWKKFQAICDAQGGMRTPPQAPKTLPVTASEGGVVSGVDCRRLARAAKLAGAPAATAAGVELHLRLGDAVKLGQPLFTLHAETAGELAYARDFVTSGSPIYTIKGQA